MTRLLMLSVDAGPAEALQQQLSHLGLPFKTRQLAGDDLVALAQTLESFRPDLVFCEPALPALPGIKALHWVRERLPEVPFIYCTAQGDDAFAASGLRAGATDCVSTSEPQRLAAVVERALRRVTERALHLRIEQELIQAQRYQRLPLLLSALAHDLRNVLQPLMFAGVVLRNTEEPKLQRLQETLENTTQKGMDIVSSMTAFAKSREAGEADLDVGALMRTLPLLLPKKTTRRVEVSFESTLGVVPCRLHQTDIEQCMLELGLAAIRAMPEGGRLRFRATEQLLDTDFFAADETPVPGLYLHLAVENDGADASYAGGDGSANLGMAICRTVAAQHRGLLRQRASGHAGGAVDLYLPLRAELADTALASRQAVLFATPDEAAVAALATLGGPLGFDIARIGDSPSAAQHLERHPLPDLAIIDTELPRLEDARIFTLLRERQYAGRVILLASPGADMDPSASSSSIRLMTKPVDAASLLAVLRESAAQASR